MSGTELRDREGRVIQDWRDWTRPKAADRHWKPGRSAMECARAWFTSPVPIVPPEVQALFGSHARLRGLALTHGRPEHITPLPERGEGRNHDLHLVGQTAEDRITVCVEAKADEPFGDNTIGRYWSDMRRRRDDGQPTRAPERVEQLLALLAGPQVAPTDPAWSDVGYQLLTASAGTVLQARADGSSVAVLVVHEFKTTATDAQKHARNAADYARFVSALCGVPADGVRDGLVYAGGSSPDLPLLVGKAVYDWSR